MVVANRSCGEDEYQTWPEWGMLTLAVSDSSEIKHRSFWRAWQTKKPTKIDRLSLQPTCSTSPGFVGAVAVTEAMVCCCCYCYWSHVCCWCYCYWNHSLLALLLLLNPWVCWCCCCYWSPGFVRCCCYWSHGFVGVLAVTEAYFLLLSRTGIEPSRDYNFK